LGVRLGMIRSYHIFTNKSTANVWEGANHQSGQRCKRLVFYLFLRHMMP
jgi:hypothetical protein